MLKDQRVASSQKIHQGRCFTFIKGQRDNCLYSEMNLPVFYIPWRKWAEKKVEKWAELITMIDVGIQLT